MRADLFQLKSMYFNSAYIGPMPKHSAALIEESVKRSLDPGFLHADMWMKMPDQLRARFARLLGSSDDTIAISSSVSELVSHVANGLELKAQDEVLLLNGDFPSMVLPWMVLAEQKGFRVHLLEPADFLNPAKFKSKLNGRTRFAGVSHVMFNTGIQFPIAELGALAQKAGVLFMADVSQSFGGMRISPNILKNVDILVGVAYKWMLGPYGTAFGYFGERALQEVRRTHASWLGSPNSKSTESLLNYSTDTTPGARKFDCGETPSFLLNAGLQGALETLEEVGLHKIETHNAELTTYFLEHVPKTFEVAAPKDFTSNIVCIKPAEGNALELRTKLAENNIDVSVREGNLRLSFHLFNTKSQVEHLLKDLQSV